MRQMSRWMSLAVSFLLAACQQSDDVEDLEARLGEHFAGLTAEDEAPMFGEELEFRALGEADEYPEAEYEDDLIEDMARLDSEQARVRAMEAERNESQRPWVWGLLATWGRQRLDWTAEDVTVWNPTIRTDCGLIAVRRLVAMEPREGVVRPRTDPQSVSFVSRTKPSFDGAFMILAVSQDDADCVETGMLHYESEALDEPIRVPLRELDDLVLREPVGDGNNVVLLADRFEPTRDDECVHGTMVGRWRRALDRDGRPHARMGRFYGRVMNEMGDLRGHVRGVWGVPRRGRFEGKQVMFGKFIDRDGRFRGLLAGRWGDGHIGGGWHLTPRFLDLHGGYRGHYTLGGDDDPDGGFFRARYASSGCRERVDGEPLAQDDGPNGSGGPADQGAR